MCSTLRQDEAGCLAGCSLGLGMRRVVLAWRKAGLRSQRVLPQRGLPQRGLRPPSFERTCRGPPTGLLAAAQRHRHHLATRGHYRRAVCHPRRPGAAHARLPARHQGKRRPPGPRWLLPSPDQRMLLSTRAHGRCHLSGGALGTPRQPKHRCCSAPGTSHCCTLTACRSCCPRACPSSASARGLR